MKYALILLMAAVLFAGCGRLLGNDPEGVTGGHEGGYGAYGSSLYGDYDYDYLFGNWQQNLVNGDHNIVTFSADWTVKVVFQNGTIAKGTYFASGNSLSINVPGWESGSETVAANGDIMSLTRDGSTITLHKLN
jgi:hypothetical protein